MFEISDKDLNFLRKHIDNIDCLLESKDINELLIELDYLMMREGFGEDLEPNDFGYKIQEIYDNILDDNINNP